MKRISVNVLLIILILATILTANGQQDNKPAITKTVDYLTSRNAQLEKALRLWSRGESDFRYHYNLVDLNSDGKQDAIVFISGSAYCGSGGCNMLIFKGSPKGFERLSEMTVSRPPVWVASTKTNGWNDLLFYNSGGGVKGFYSLLKFNGKSYPKNPTVQPALSKNSKASFVEYLSGIEQYDSGIKLQ